MRCYREILVYHIKIHQNQLFVFNFANRKQISEGGQLLHKFAYLVEHKKQFEVMLLRRKVN